MIFWSNFWEEWSHRQAVNKKQMKNLLKSHVLILSITICLSAALSFWALEKDSCFEINIDNKVKIKAGCKILLFQKK